jgi:TonB family protein
MNTTVVNFLVESGISLTIFTLIYLLFLRKETFFMLNRIYLMVSAIFSILLPFLHFQESAQMPSVMLDEVTVTAVRFQNLLQTVTVYGSNFTVRIEQLVQSIGLLKIIYMLGTTIFALLFIVRLIQLIVLVLTNESEVRNGIRIVKIRRDVTPFSFFNIVFVNGNNADQPGMKEMLAHEMEHVRQRHSLDVMIMELVTISQWFNPFIWLLKRSIRENHEFLADHGVLKPGVSPAAYRLLLLGSSMGLQPVIANNFNYSLIKIRIKMMTKIKSPKRAALKLLTGILATAALFIIFAFDGTQTQPQEKKTTGKTTAEAAKAEQKTSTGNTIFMVVEKMPEFPGGEVAVREYIAKSIKYPEDAKKAGIQGKVYVTFVVDKTGKVVDPILAKSASPSLDKEALRVVETMPVWIPGQQRGENIAVQYTIPIQFKLQ